VERGVTICYQTQAQEIAGDTIIATDGRRATFSHLICNQDVLAAAQSWLRSTYRTAEIERMLTPPLSCSGFVLFLGVQRRYPHLAHHNIFFSNDYPQEFAEIFQAQQLPPDPTIYISITARTDAEHAPAGQDNFFVLVNSPSLSAAHWTPLLIESYADRVVTRLEQAGLTDLSRAIVHRTCFTAKDFAQRDLSHHGSLYGWASHSIRTSLLRPPLRHPHHRRIHFVGGTTHPGGGIPLVLLSAKMVAEKIGR
jgi:phytoene dehydrogenase-like protein